MGGGLSSRAPMWPRGRMMVVMETYTHRQAFAPFPPTGNHIVEIPPFHGSESFKTNKATL